jgi:hypothetical protein
MLVTLCVTGKRLFYRERRPSFVFCPLFPLLKPDKSRKWPLILVAMRRMETSLWMRRIPMKSKPLSLIKNHSLTAAQSQEGYHATHGNQGRKQWTGSV